MQLQQGDTLYKKVEEVPEDALVVERKNGAIVIAEGEATGHAHRIFDVDAFLFEVNGKRYLKNSKEVTVRHEEHHAVTIPAGIWEIGQVREYDYFQDMERTVRD